VLRDAGPADKVTEVARTVGIRTGDTGDDARSATF
jgi:hypothetical protein